MNRTRHLAHTAALAAAFVFGSSSLASAAVELDLQENTLSQRASYGITATSSVGAGITANEWIGIYKFKASGDITGDFWSTCLSPAGVLNTDAHTYTAYSFAAGSPGKNPNAWAAGTEGDAGIQNAQYLWRLFSSTIITSGTSAQGTGLVLAMYYALYDSTGYGVVDTTSARFQLTSPVSGAINNAMNSYLAALNYASVNANLGTGSILRSTESGAGQDLIWITTPTGPVVPEPATMIAGALLALPFGVSTIRILRKKQVA